MRASFLQNARRPANRETREGQLCALRTLLPLTLTLTPPRGERGLHRPTTEPALQVPHRPVASRLRQSAPLR